MKNSNSSLKSQLMLCFLLVLMMIPFYGMSQSTQLPFSEDWSSGSFEPFWTYDQNWVINSQFGNPEPAAEFKWDPVIFDYQSSITSGLLNGVYQDTVSNPFIDGYFMLAFDIQLNDNSQSGNEYFLCEVWADSIWHTVATYDNANGNFDWINEEIDISDVAFGKMFKVRFKAEGVNSADILYWYVDNIEIYHYCVGPRNLYGGLPTPSTIELMWSPPLISKLKAYNISNDIAASGNAAHLNSFNGYNIYRSFDGNGYEFIDYTVDTTYIYFPDSAGMYTFYVTAVYINCEPQSNEWYTDWPPLGLDEKYVSTQIQVFPNPSNGLINIESENAMVQVCLMDGSGRTLKSHKLSNETQYSMDVSGYAPGIYLLRVDTEEGSGIRKLVIKD